MELNQEEQELVQRMNDVYARITSLYHRWEQLHGLNPFELQTVLALYPDKAVNQKEICEMYKMPKQTVSHVAGRLQKNGYLADEPDEQDKRAKKIFLTESGRTYAEQQMQMVHTLDGGILQRMGQERYAALVEELNAFATALNEETTISQEK